ncbi:PBP1A family penicillin-binding protein [Lysinibacillus agricola]|uniref:PBP1A family penicillin-binding protein n=1 Tax=Lysinibacillus agricola TaxID=2590012 RepID=A0ABX7AVY9_9BACI|nr:MULTISPECIES: penicillin-binding protein 1A [Lysinibacillus]KOS63530.1 penicillin-binding protein 1A [Lysinibacillus sp. FJAT-14222]QQP14131.1 PBP1A family penicillin-binding protein [Lysinibacillus agricola]
MTERRPTRGEHQKALAQKNKKSAPKPSKKKWFKRITLTLVAIVAACFIGGAGLFAYYASTAPELDEDLLKDPVSSEFYDINGDRFATIGAENRKYIKYEDIPEDMINAILATEDVRFFKHHGMDFYRLGGAVLANLRDGFGAQGASTLTQQVVKNSFLQNEKKLKRKAQEAWLAFQLERKYSKEEIFEMYFNKMLMSGRVYGFGTAAQYFYGKELKDLDLAEEALLAGLVQRPNAYNPLKNPELAEKRRNTVLGLMYQHGKITKAEMEEAKKVDVQVGLADDATRQKFAGSKYDAFLDVVINELEDNGDGTAMAEGIKVYTTLDPKAQQIVENIMNDDSNFPTENIQSGAAVIDTKTGQIQAIGGGRNYGAERGWSYAYDLHHQPGSTMKPLIDYGPAIENLKWSTGQTLVDEPMTYTNSKQNITNWDNKYMGAITARKALYASRNVPAVKALQEVGIDKAKEFIGRLGINAKNIYESDAIGGGDITMSPTQMAASFAAFGNNGVYTDPYSITKIVYRDGKTTKDYTPESNVAMSDYTAYMVTDMLRDVVGNKPDASGTYANVPGLDIAGKTGTTNYAAADFSKHNLPDTSVPDSWFAGYTTNYSIAIWSGYEKHFDPITTWDERRLPQYLFKEIMEEISANVETPRFKKPSSVVEATIEVGSKPLKLASNFTPSEKRQTELFVRGTEPKEVSNEYAMPELSTPYNVSASLDLEGESINISWEHDAMLDPETDEPLPTTFEVSAKREGGETIPLGKTESKGLTVSNTLEDGNYTISVVAVVDGTRSKPGTTSFQVTGIADEDLEPDTPDEPDIEEPTAPDEDDNNENNGNHNGNGNENNGNNNNNNNGNGNNNGNENNGNTENNGNPPGNNGNNNGSQPPTTPTEPVVPPTGDGENTE